MSRPRIAIVVPAYNEAANLPAVVTALHELQSSRPDWEWMTVIVDDGSTDDTPRVLAQLGRQFPLVAIHSPVNVGIGAAVQAGFQFVVEWGADVTLQFDGDHQHPADAIPSLVEPVLAGSADVVVGSRYLSGSGGRVSGALRRLGTGLFAALLRLVIGLKIRDVTSGFRAFNREATEYISRYYPDDYPEVEIYVPLVRVRFRIAEVPVDMRPRTGGQSSITGLASAYYMLKVTLAVIVHLIKRIPARRRKRRDT